MRPSFFEKVKKFQKNGENQIIDFSKDHYFVGENGRSRSCRRTTHNLFFRLNQISQIQEGFSNFQENKYGLRFEFLEQFMIDTFLIKLTQLEITGSQDQIFVLLGDLIIKFHI